MATFQNTTGTIDFRQTRDAIITRALRICSAIADSEVATPSMIANASEAFNALVKQWDSMGIHLWTTTEGVVFLQPNQFRYQLNRYLSAFDNPDRAAQSWRLSTLQNSMAQGETTLTLNPFSDYGLTNVVIGDEIGIVLDGGHVFWGVVAFIDQGVYTLSVPIIGSASQGAYVFVFRERIEQPLRIVSSRRFILSNRIDTPMLSMSRLDYREQPNKETAGTITSYYYDPQLFTGYYYVWPAPSDVQSIARITYYRRMQDMASSGDTFDLPQEWANCLTWNLAKEIAPEYDVPFQKYQGMILPRAAETLDMVSGFDREPESAFYQPAHQPYSR